MATDPGTSRAFATDVVRQLGAAGHVALWAGGCVRDLLMGRIAKDYDVATSATPEQVRVLFGKKRTLAVGASFGVIVVLPPTPAAEPVEVATFRTEGPYHDGRRPSQVAFATPEEDARRRDFTINGMFYDPIEERVFDYVGGEADLRSRRLRAIGDPLERMTEDKLRMLRTVRFAATLQLNLDATTCEAVRQMASEIQMVSAERIAQELRRVLAHRERTMGLRLLRETGLLAVLFPEILAGADRVEAVLAALPEEASFELAAAALLHEIPASPHEPPEATGTVWEITRRLKLSNDEMRAIAWLVSHQASWNDAPTQSMAPLKRVLAHPLASDLRCLVRAIAVATRQDLAAIEFVDQFAMRHTPAEINPPEFVTGRDLIEAGLSPGPQFKAILDSVRDAQLNGFVTNRAEAIDLLATLTAQ